MKVTCAPARPEDAAELACVMRQADVEECLASGYEHAQEAVAAGIANTRAWSVRFDGELAFCFGVDTTSMAPEVIIWFLSGQVVERAKLTFFRTTRSILEELHDIYPRLCNLVDARYTRALSWLGALGFRRGATVPHPVTGLPFIAVYSGGA